MPQEKQSQQPVEITFLYDKNEKMKQELTIDIQKLDEFLAMNRDIMQALGSKSRETVYFLKQLNPSIPIWMTPDERKVAKKNNDPKDPIEFYQVHYDRVQEYMSQAVLKLHNFTLYDSISNRVNYLRRKGLDPISMKDVVPAKSQFFLTDALLDIITSNFQISTSEFYKTIHSISSLLLREERK